MLLPPSSSCVCGFCRAVKNPTCSLLAAFYNHAYNAILKSIHRASNRMKLRRSSFSSSIVTKDTSCYSSSSRRRRRGGLQITCSLSSFLLLPLFVYLSRNGSSINAFLLPSPSIDVKVALMRRHVSERQIPQCELKEGREVREERKEREGGKEQKGGRSLNCLHIYIHV